MTRAYELSQADFELIRDVLPPNGQRGRQWNDHLQTLNGMFWVLHTGAQWREVPARYGHWQSIYHRFSRWRRDGTLARILERLHLKLDEQGRIDHQVWHIDATMVRASRSAAGARGEKPGPGRTSRSRSWPVPRRLWQQAARPYR